ncbi:MAG: FtsX-like permease family protein, partial [Gemmatimonadaceae bacterium]
MHFASSPLDARMLAFALVVAAAAGVLAGLVPALQASSPNLTAALKSGARDGGSHRSRLRDALVLAQAALSVVLLVGAALFVRSLRNVEAHDFGYSVSQLVFADMTYDTRDSARDAARPARLTALAPRIAAMPGVERVALTSTRPEWDISWEDFVPDFDTTGRKMPMGFVTAVSPGYFAASGTALLRGRTFDAGVAAGAPFTVIVNRAMADALWPHEKAIGHCIHFDKATAPCATVIGVAETALFQTVGETPSPQFYVSLDHPPFQFWGAQEVVIRAEPAHIAEIEGSVQQLLRGEFSGATPRLTTMESIMEPLYRPWRLGATLFTLFGALALSIAGIGIYSTVSYAVSQRTHEFGVRVALGARTGDVLRQVLGEGLRTVVAGVVVGILLALVAGRLVASLLYGIAANDPAVMLVVTATLLGIAALAALVPAWRAAKADP